MFGRATIRLGIGPHSSCVRFSFFSWQLSSLSQPALYCSSTHKIMSCVRCQIFVFRSLIVLVCITRNLYDTSYNWFLRFDFQLAFDWYQVWSRIMCWLVYHACFIDL